MRQIKSAIAFLFAVVSMAAVAAPGELDTSFGTNGSVRLDFGTPQSIQIQAAARQPDGKTIVAAVVPFQDCCFGSSSLAAGRFNVDGTLDATFGVGGWGWLSPANGVARTVAIQPDGKIVVLIGGGITQLARLTPNGLHDEAFAMNHGILTVGG